MANEVSTDLIEKIREADMVLVGVGEDLQVKLEELEKIPAFVEKRNELMDDENGEYWYPYLIRHFLQPEFFPEKVKFYQKVKTLLEGKNYFVVSLCTDDIMKSVFSADKSAEKCVYPCGGYDKLQCPRNCNEKISAFPSELSQNMIKWIDSEISLKDMEMPVCPDCGEALVFNQIGCGNYAETYLDRWKRYQLWLEGTMNCSLTILELGVGMRYPSAFRWPVEKIIAYQKKAFLYRVHETLYHLPAEGSERASSVKQDPEKYIMNIVEDT